MRQRLVVVLFVTLAGCVTMQRPGIDPEKLADIGPAIEARIAVVEAAQVPDDVKPLVAEEVTFLGWVRQRLADETHNAKVQAATANVGEVGRVAAAIPHPAAKIAGYAVLGLSALASFVLLRKRKPVPGGSP